MAQISVTESDHRIRIGQVLRAAPHPYAMAVATVATSGVLRFWILQDLGTRNVYVTFYPAVILAALYGGLWPGLVATALSAVMVDYFWIEPVGHLFIGRPIDWVCMVAYLAGCVLISYVMEAMHRATVRAQEAEAQAALATERQHAQEALLRTQREAEAALQLVNAELEKRVEERTSQLRLVNKSLQQSESRFRSVLENSLDGAYRWNLQTDAYDYLSPKLEQIIGCTREEMKSFSGKDIMARVHRDDLENVQRELDRTLGGGCGQLEYRYLRKDGKYRWLVNTINVLIDSNGRPLYRVGNLRDVTQSKEAERALQESEERLRMAAEAARFGTYTYDFATGRGDWSPELLNLLGLNPGESIPLDSDYLFVGLHPEDRGEFLTRMTAANDPRGDGVLKLDCRIVLRDGAVRWLQVRGRTTFTGEGESRRAARVAGCVQDITERKESEDAMRESESRFRALFENSPDAVFLTIPDGRVLAANPAACAMFGMSEAELRVAGRKGVSDPDDARHAVALEERQRTGRSVKTELSFIRRNGGRFIAEVDSVILPLLPVRSFVILRDITERKRVEREIRLLNEDLEKRVQERTGQLDETIQQLRHEIGERKRAEARIREISLRLNEVRESERSAIAKELHDEIGQLLTGLKMMLTVVARRMPAPAPKELAQMHETVEELMMRVRELSINLRPLVLDYLGLLEALTFYIDRFRVRTGIDVQVEIPELSRRLSPAIETALFRVTQEALTNVARHSGVKEVSVKLWIERTCVGLMVEDRGKGFDSSVLPAVTCGLSGMNERVTTLGGRFEVTSKPGGGTRVQVWLALEWAQ